jgi:hypothetical protein
LVSLEVDLPLENHFLSSSCDGPSGAIVVGGGHSSGGQMVMRMAQSSCHCSHLFDNFLSSSSLLPSRRNRRGRAELVCARLV